MHRRAVNGQQEDGAWPQTVKLLLAGDSGTGKSSLLLRFCEDRFLGEDVHMATIGVDFKVKFMDLPDLDIQRLKLTIWDTAGQERFRSLTSSYYRGAHGIILVYDVCSRDSFLSIRTTWLPEIERALSTEFGQDGACCPATILMLVGNKLDKSASRAVSTEEGERLARDLCCLFMECSAKTKIGVKAAFEELVRRVLDSPQVWDTGFSLTSSLPAGSSSKSCSC